MMIRALVSIAGDGFALFPGDETDRFPDADARRLVANGAAIFVDRPVIERAVEIVPARETRKTRK